MKIPYQILGVFAVLVAALLPQTASAKCVARIVASNDGTAGAILAVAPDSGSNDLASAGYKDVSCGNLDKDAYREQVCNPKTAGNGGVQRQLEIQAGISFVQLCSAARAEAGLPASQPDQAAAQFSPSNRRPPVPNSGPAMVGPLGGPNGANSQTGGN